MRPTAKTTKTPHDPWGAKPTRTENRDAIIGLVILALAFVGAVSLTNLALAWAESFMVPR